jgi:hypothetical protein
MLPKLVWIQPRTALIRYVGPRLRNLQKGKNLRASQLLLWHSKIESTVRYLGIEEDDALEMAEQTEI